VDIKDFMPWVKVIAQRIFRTLPSNIMLDDLVQDGMIGLIMALREYNPDLGVSFQTFAGNKIKWAIMDGLRAADWADKHTRRRANKVAKAVEKLQATLHREPSKREMADALGVRVHDVTTILGEAYGFVFVRIDEDIRNEVLEIPDISMEPAAIVERREAYYRAISCLNSLHPSERKAIILRIMCDKTGRQSAAEMRVSESRICQLYRSATEKLARYV